MALANTTLSAALAVDDTVMTVAAATSVAAGLYAKINGEWAQVTKAYVVGSTSVPILRGQDGTATKAHVTTSAVSFYVLPSDIPNPAPGTAITSPAQKVTIKSSMAASGAYTPQAGEADEEVTLLGTSVIAVTLTNPLLSQDGKKVTFKANGIAAHTITYTTVGFGNVGGTADLATFGTTQIQEFVFQASGGFWLIVSGLATATANVSGPAIT